MRALTRGRRRLRLLRRTRSRYSQAQLSVSGQSGEQEEANKCGGGRRVGRIGAFESRPLVPMGVDGFEEVEGGLVGVVSEAPLEALRGEAGEGSAVGEGGFPARSER